MKEPLYPRIFSLVMLEYVREEGVDESVQQKKGKQEYWEDE